MPINLFPLSRLFVFVLVLLRVACSTTFRQALLFAAVVSTLVQRSVLDTFVLCRCSLPLLKSRNSGVVLAVCTAHYYCSSRTGSTMNQIAKAMVRILRNRREIQFVVLDAIR